MITYAIIAITSIVSIMAFSNNLLADRLIFYPPAVKRGEWYRLITYGVLHGDYMHLIFNMFTLYLFGVSIEHTFKIILGVRMGSICYILLYASALIISILPTYLKNRNNTSYHGLGASGAVSAIVFAYVLINPMSFMGIMFIPIWLPAFLFALLFILISAYLDKKQYGAINHLAHITGGIYGMAFMILAFAILTNINLLQYFVQQIHINSINDIIRFGF